MTWQGNPRTTTTAWRHLRTQILERDNYTCHICGRPGANEVDHLLPASRGGSDHPSNLAAIHQLCHRRKSSAEGSAARWHPSMRRARDIEQHPGLI